MLKQSNSSIYSHYDELTVYLNIETKYSIEQMMKWEIQALFVPSELLDSTFRPYARITYYLPDSVKLGIIINLNSYKSVKRDYFTVAGKVVHGIKIPLENWFEVTFENYDN